MGLSAIRLGFRRIPERIEIGSDHHDCGGVAVEVHDDGFGSGGGQSEEGALPNRADGYEAPVSGLG
jgi:hypothetical protein